MTLSLKKLIIGDEVAARLHRGDKTIKISD
jgi:hypothetical protein